MDSVPQADAKEQQRAESLFKFGHEAAAKGNIPYAIDMFRDACRIAPLELRFRQALRAIERRKFNNEPSKVGVLSGARLQPIRLRVRTAKGRGHWLEAIEAIEDGFVVSPWDVALSRDLAEAAEHLGGKALARWALEAVQQQAADDVAFWKHMAHVYDFAEDYKRAILCWERIKKLAPHDQEATHQIHALSASETIQGSGLHEQLRQPGEPIGRSGPEVPAEAEALRGQPALSPEARFEHEVAEDPSRHGPYIELAEHYRLQGRLDEARDVLARGVKALPEDGLLRDAYAEVQIARLKKAIEGLKLRLRDHPDDREAKEKLAKLGPKLAEYELAEYRRRAEARPEDLMLRYEFGVRLAEAGQHDAAIGEFQAARSSPALKVKALIAAGGSFEATGVPKLAERSYAEALKAADADDPETLNDIHYRLGRVAEQMGNLEGAEEHYNEVAANNFNYLDVAQRLRSLNQRMSS